MPSKRKKPSIKSAGPLTPHTKALYEAGANLLKDSVGVVREYCKSMITTSFAAIPVYLALLKAFVSEKKPLAEAIGLCWLIPIVLFLAAAALFSAGYLPGRTQLSLELPEQIQMTVQRAMLRRFWFGVAGFVLLSLGVIAAIATVAVLSTR
jgi:hypothetical protein